ncbi:MAG: D-2-hydroxyacid dehydrogenase [Planctomycetaceae bacterium]|nr:D-2-hydroxyacid dehydrogenase [Planctomycetaceae bacterium]
MRKLLVFPAIDAERLQALRAAAPELQIVNAAGELDALQEIADASGFFGKISPALLARATQLEWIQSPTASLEHYLFPELVAHPCTISNMRGIFSDVIADHVLGYVLCFARQLHTYIRRQPDGVWRPIGDDVHLDMSVGPGRVSGADRAHRHLADCRMGVIGAGGIGAEVCRRAAAFGMSLSAVDPQVRSIPGIVDDVWPVARLRDLMQQADFVVVAAPHTPETEKLIRYEQLCWMSRSAVLINVGRGAIVDLADLTRALDEQRLGGAALDVLETEPLPSDHPLWRRDNVIITPHVAAASPRIAERHFAVLRDNLQRFARGETPQNLVDKHHWF